MANRSLLPPAFLREVDLEVRKRQPPGTAPLQTHVRSRLAQFWFGPDRSIHYEVWIHERTAQIELGLHFESTAERNRDLYRRFDAEMIAVQATLGHTLWLEEWDRGWARVYETQPLWPLDAVRVVEVSDRLCEIMVALQPLLDE